MSDRTLVHVARMTIRWGDMDAMGHVNNAVYFRYLEQARIEWLSAIDCAPNPAGEGPVIINAHCTFLKQLKYPGEIEVRTYIGEIGRTTLKASRKSGGSMLPKRSLRKAAPRWCGSISCRRNRRRCPTRYGSV